MRAGVVPRAEEEHDLSWIKKDSLYSLRYIRLPSGLNEVDGVSVIISGVC